MKFIFFPLLREGRKKMENKLDGKQMTNLHDFHLMNIFCEFQSFQEFMQIKHSFLVWFLTNDFVVIQLL